MFKAINPLAALLGSAAIVYGSSAFSQAPIVDASMPPAAQPAAQAPAPAVANATGQGELFYQLQLLQQEVMQLRGIVEEQSHHLKQMKQQNMERYIDLDRRVSGLTTRQPASVKSGSSNTAGSGPAPMPSSSSAKALPGEAEAYKQAYGLAMNKQFDQALGALTQFLIDFPDGKYAPNAYYWLGELHLVVKPQDLEASRQAFAQLLAQYPAHTKLPDAKYKLAKVYYLKGNKTKSQELLNQVVSEYAAGGHSAAKLAEKFLRDNF